MLSVDPRKVDRHLPVNQPATWRLTAALRELGAKARPLRKPIGKVQAALYSAEPFVVAPRHFDRAIPVAEERRFRLLLDLIETAGGDPLRSRWYAEACAELKRAGFYRHKGHLCHSPEEIAAMLDRHVMGMVRGIERNGYDPALAPDSATGFVDGAGRVVKSDAGNHRFYAARILGARGIPVEILGIHRGWYRAQLAERPGLPALDAIRAGLAEVEAAHS